MSYQIQNTSTELLKTVLLEELNESIGTPLLNVHNLNYTPVKKSEPVSYNFVNDESGSKIFISTVDHAGQIKESVIKTCEYESEVELFGSKFLLSKDDGFFILSHNQFTLSGEGNSIAESVKDLVKNIKFLKDDMANTPSEKLDASGFEFKKFLLETILI